LTVILEEDGEVGVGFEADVEEEEDKNDDDDE
jgi:hypothetical protein